MHVTHADRSGTASSWLGVSTRTWATATAGAVALVGGFLVMSDMAYGFVIFAVIFFVAVVAAAGERGSGAGLGRALVNVAVALIATTLIAVVLLVLAGAAGVA